MKTLPLFLYFLSPLAMAAGNFSGHWVATNGSVSGVVNGSCSKVEIIIVQSEKGITTQSYKASCGAYSSDWGPVDEDFRDGKVFEGDQEVGTVNDTTMLTSAPDGGVIYTYNLELSEDASGNPILHSAYGTKNFVGSVVIAADLKKISN